MIKITHSKNFVWSKRPRQPAVGIEMAARARSSSAYYQMQQVEVRRKNDQMLWAYEVFSFETSKEVQCFHSGFNLLYGLKLRV